MTIRHVVTYRLAEPDAAARAAQAQRIVERMRALVGVVPAIDALSAGVGTGDGDADLAIVVDVADRDALEAYATHPVHQVLLADVRGLVRERVACDFEV